MADPKPAPPPPKDLLAEIKTVGSHQALVNDIKHNAEDVAKHLHHVETVDKAVPAISCDVHVQKWDKEGFLKEIESPHRLKHVESTNDRSSPKIEPTVSLKMNDHNKLLQEIEAPHQLRHVETEDKSQPVITKTASMRVTAADDGAAE